MMPTAEAFERYEKFIPWLNENHNPDISISWEDLGLKDGAPEEAKAAYEEYLAMVQRRRETGRM